MELIEVMKYLESKGSEQTRKTFLKHGGPDNMFGVKVGDLKPIEKKEKNNHTLAMQLYATGNSDAQYLAGLIADPTKFTEGDFEKWGLEAKWSMILEYALAWNIAESPICMQVCSKWINSENTSLQEAAWAALGAYLGITDNSLLDIPFHNNLIDRISKTIHQQANRVKYCMNGYLIALGCAVPELSQRCKDAGVMIGKVEVFMGETSCKVPDIVTYIEKVEKMNRIGKKKKKAKY
ncbi:MAG: DNA alkylation repair protein [Crocinitomicaceae bacterium]|nr:DNA alkylation repair protein [Crocinitomicaceae bacterium]